MIPNFPLFPLLGTVDMSILTLEWINIQFLE